MTSKQGTLMTQLQRVQGTIQHTRQRINVLEKKLEQTITCDNRESLESELVSAKEILDRNETKLLGLQKDNTKSFMIATCIIFIIFLLFGLYSMIYNIY